MTTALLLSMALLATSEPAPRRFAMVVGQNLGDSEDPPLRYAESDAKRMLEALRDVGGVASGDGIAVLGASATTLSQALRDLTQRLQREARPKDQLFLYVSGHADEGEL